MGNRAALITQADATRLFKAARAAGYERARFVSYPDGRVEVLVDTVRPCAAPREVETNEWDDVLE